MLRGVAYLLLYGDFVLGITTSEEGDPTRCGMYEVHEHPHEGALAASVGTYDRHHAAGLHVQVYRAQLEVRVGLPYVPERDYRSWAHDTSP